MTRYFYPASRAHHAYVMAKDFGMKFKKRNGLWATESLPMIAGSTYQIEIAGESLHLLEPKPLDKVAIRPGGGGKEFWDEVCRILRPGDEDYPYTGDGRSLVLLDGGSHHYFDRVALIFQRDGIPFHYPEQGE